ncbi:uncharacterized protein LDX57_012096 [Aspergillus melleus]|uniref:uncharacterized protein n=1 Tax=Aspergillus melleus TaxID=138277 RepID=UPI001E8D6A66|nr:uncharacterized protein LDX57_012096 [Aspergillus melleus]KAH8434449.1 hypothetical protein LDX57_012096 [Aspergillus melleus]
MDDGRNTVRLERILELQGCLRINRDYHVPVLVDAADWGRSIKMHDSEDELLPELAVPLNMSLRAQGHESIVAAARKMLSGPSRWWVVDVYVEDPGQPTIEPWLHTHLVRSLREHFPNERQPPHGLIYQRLRLYEGHLGSPRDEHAAAAWWAILQHDPRSRKHRYVAAFFKHPTLPRAFDALLPIPGLWACMYLGVLHTMVSLHCDEPILFYLERIRSMWGDQILGGDATLAGAADAHTVRAIPSRVPQISQQDKAFLEKQMMTDRTLFPSISLHETREAIWARLQSIDTPIPSLRTFFQDLLYLGVARKAMQTLLCLREPGSTGKVTIDEALAGQRPAGTSQSLEALTQQTRQGLQELWRFCFQYGLEIAGTARRLRQPRKPERLPDSLHTGNEPTWISRTTVLRHFFWLAEQEGFTVPSRPDLVPQAVSLPTPQSRDAVPNLNPGCDEPVARRRGVPYVDTVDADRFALEKDRLWERWDSPHITAEFVRRSQFQAFFGYLHGNVAHSQAAESPWGDALASDGAGTPDHTMPDQGTSGDPSVSPSIADMLPDIRSPSSWSNAFQVSGLFGLESFQMPGWNLRVDVEIPGRQTKTFLLQEPAGSNDSFLQGGISPIESFLNGLGPEFVFYVPENRTILREQVHTWHQQRPDQTLTARLDQQILQEATATKGNSFKRHIRELTASELESKLAEVAAWVDRQADGHWIVSTTAMPTINIAEG